MGNDRPHLVCTMDGNFPVYLWSFFDRTNQQVFMYFNFYGTRGWVIV